MRDGGRVAAALSVFEDFERRHVPFKVALADWSRNARFAGAKDRAFISGLVLDLLRRRGSMLAAGGGPRGAIALVLHHLWDWPADRVTAAFADVPHGPGALSPAEVAALGTAPMPNMDDVPDLVRHLLTEASDDPLAEVAAMCHRAPVDLRVNTLLTDESAALDSLASLGARPAPLLRNALRIDVPEAEHRGPQVEIMPAFLRGWVEVQDLGSQIAAAAVGPIAGARVLDYCAGGGGKTLALAAQMQGQGRVYAYDADPRRIAPLFERQRRAGADNIDVLSPAEGPRVLDHLREGMDVVFVDAPCSGTGTWRRHPDTKWRLTAEQLARRHDEQASVLRQAAQYVRPGGIMVFVTCSVLTTENEAQVARFCDSHPAFAVEDPVAAITATGLLRPGGMLPATATGILRLSPARTGSDGFGIARLRRGDA